jgi:hypothetical protein
MSSRKNEKKACSAGRKAQKQPYDNRPRSGPRTPSTTETVRVILPAEPPPLNPAAARAMLRILLKAYDQLADSDDPKRGAE